MHLLIIDPNFDARILVIELWNCREVEQTLHKNLTLRDPTPGIQGVAPPCRFTLCQPDTLSNVKVKFQEIFAIIILISEYTGVQL